MSARVYVNTITQKTDQAKCMKFDMQSFDPNCSFLSNCGINIIIGIDPDVVLCLYKVFWGGGV